MSDTESKKALQKINNILKKQDVLSADQLPPPRSQIIEEQKQMPPPANQINEEPKKQARIPRPTMNLKNTVKNDGGVLKQTAVQTYEEAFDLAIKHGKMTEERKQELIAKIERVANNDITVFSGVDSDIKVKKDDTNGEIVIDMVVHYMLSDENDADRMNLSYAACKATIKNATTS